MIGLLLLSMPASYAAGRVGEGGPIYLEHADNIYYDQYEMPDAQRLSGNVIFRHAGMRMVCDSAVYYEKSQSFRAFGRVRMTQGDTLSLRGDSLYYDGTTQTAQVVGKVVMKHRAQTLTTDELYYLRRQEKGYFPHEGTLIDGDNKLEAYYGEYFVQTRKAYFEDPDYRLYDEDENFQGYPVVLTNPKYTVVTPRLYYDLNTKDARVAGRTNILSGNSNIFTTEGTYNTETQVVNLDSHSRVKDDVRKYTAEGDYMDYDKATGRMTARHNVVFRDFKNKCELRGDTCEYFENADLHCDSAFVVGERSVAIDYSNGEDTLFLHADSLWLFEYNTKTDSAYRIIRGYHKARVFRNDVQAVCDSIYFSTRDSVLVLYRDPVVWTDNRQILGEQIHIFLNDSTVDSIYVVNQALLIEQVDQEQHYNQISSRVMKAYFKEGELYLGKADDNVRSILFPLEKDSTIIYHNYSESAKMRMYVENRKLQKVWTPAVTGTVYPIGRAPKDRTFLPTFAWLDKMRPADKDDIYVWRGKSDTQRLRAKPRRQAPVQTLQK